ncbi:ABC transporter ATP-binding protein [Rhizobium rhizogenes]|uniref:ABC transporter ATP-binding protein n=1 Tax=Rhizobium rhizogenes TaxID=359 RepID=UPI000648839E|nr:ATP-binding cassette domain-containing protein [Rhizobium rhizogenes]
MTSDRAIALPALHCRDITVTYGDFVALSSVSVAFEPGLIHAVVGQNGAGKTTFARVAAGLVKPEPGEILIDGGPIEPGKVKEARRAGVELVHQSFALPPSFTISEAIEFGATGQSSLFTSSQLNRRWRGHLHSLDVTVDPHRRIRDLPVETQQGVEIARALVSNARILILDEPTAVLSPSGIERLFERVRMLKARGVTVILILHKIREVLGIADTVTVLRGGKLIAAAVPCATIGPPELAELIIGTSAPSDDAAVVIGASTPADQSHTSTVSVQPFLKMENVSTQSDAEGSSLEDVSLAIRPGEIIGVAGIEGNGQRALVQAIAGLVDVPSGKLVLGGDDITNHDLGDRRSMGLRIIPFERNSEGLSLSSSLWENWSIARLLSKGLLDFVSPKALKRESVATLDAWSVRYATPTQRAGSLSGGNAQKLIFAREIDENAKLIIAAQPTRGLDIGATLFVWKALREARDRGCAIILISSDLDELFDISDRIIVMLSGRIAAEFSSPFDMAKVGAAMTGADQ